PSEHRRARSSPPVPPVSPESLPASPVLTVPGRPFRYTGRSAGTPVPLASLRCWLPWPRSSRALPRSGPQAVPPAAAPRRTTPRSRAGRRSPAPSKISASPSSASPACAGSPRGPWQPSPPSLARGRRQSRLPRGGALHFQSGFKPFHVPARSPPSPLHSGAGKEPAPGEPVPRHADGPQRPGKGGKPQARTGAQASPAPGPPGQGPAQRVERIQDQPGDAKQHGPQQAPKPPQRSGEGPNHQGAQRLEVEQEAYSQADQDVIAQLTPVPRQQHGEDDGCDGDPKDDVRQRRHPLAGMAGGPQHPVEVEKEAYHGSGQDGHEERVGLRGQAHHGRITTLRLILRSWERRDPTRV